MKRSVFHFILIMLILGCSAVTAHTISPDTSDPVQEAYKLTFTGEEPGHQ